MYIVRDAITGKESAHPSLKAARYAALDVKEGEIVRVRLNFGLDRLHLRCALFNRDNYAREVVQIAVIEDGMARKIAGVSADVDDAEDNEVDGEEEAEGDE